MSRAARRLRDEALMRLYFMPDGNEMVQRRARVPKGSIVEAWADRAGGGTFWVGEDSKAPARRGRRARRWR